MTEPRGGTDHTMTDERSSEGSPSQSTAVRCHARRTNGEPCGNYAMRGSRVCHAHGGKAPAVRQAAGRRMAEAALARQVDQFLAAADAKRKALQPWTGELGPRPLWSWHSPDHLRRIAAEMRRTADELCDLAKQNKLGY